MYFNKALMEESRKVLLSTLIEDLFDFLSEAVFIAEYPSSVVVDMNMAARELCGQEEGQSTSIVDIFEAAGSKALTSLLEGNPWKMDEPCTLKVGEQAGRKVFLSWQVLHREDSSLLLLSAKEQSPVKEDDQTFRVVNDDLVTLMASSLSHDLNNIIGVMSGSISTIKRAPVDAAKAQERFELLEKSVARAVSINQELMGYARRGAEAKQAESLAQALREAITEAREVLPPDYSVNLTISDDLPEIEVAKLSIKGVALSLILNSWQAMPDGGEISVEVTLCKETEGIQCAKKLLLPPGDYALIVVADNGPGIPDGIRESVFEPFFSTDTRSEGAGLGLTAVERIMRSLGGGVRLADSDGGSRFELFLPTVR
jgi:signal transduction histidine kinase